MTHVDIPAVSDRYRWPGDDAVLAPDVWTIRADGSRRRAMPESAASLRDDSRWPAFFPSAISIVTSIGPDGPVVEKVVGASIVNRFPYVVALSLCRIDLSDRHYARTNAIHAMTHSGEVAVQFLEPGSGLERVLRAVNDMPDARATDRLQKSGLAASPGATVASPVFDDAFLVYEGAAVRPDADFERIPVNSSPWVDVGSHRVMLFEITAIQLRRDIADGESTINWQSLPDWNSGTLAGAGTASAPQGGYVKSYTARYRYPSAATASFEADELVGNRRVKILPRSAADQVEIDNDRARWPCFFPSSVGMITSTDRDGRRNVMPCGSTTIVSRDPLVIAPCISYAAINDRYAPRHSLDAILETGRFGCSVPFLSDAVIAGITYSGNTSLRDDPDKLGHSGFAAADEDGSPRLLGFPVHFSCRLVDRVRLGTHWMLLGEATSIVVDPAVSATNPLSWSPWATVSAR